ncbi:sarcosine oxidase, gamma subunit [Sphingomonas colocasiae]|uniref:Sarcosine oxidase, gamma subunit n=2 Tax=Sphingomonas colocasiae TaxID=1848973 RepID=A0ABS7PQ94_9SPHN|nr:sarcosine oxidase, gamma subunit [Sphingomonas colocasiae]
MTRHILRCRERRVAEASDLLGLDLPRSAYGTASHADRHALWLGPDEWLILAPEPFAATADVWAAIGASFVEVSDRQVALQLSGAGADTCLAGGCPLDLALPAFPIGACARTVFHKAEIIVWRTGSSRFQVEIGRSFAPYVTRLLSQQVQRGRSLAVPT